MIRIAASVLALLSSPPGLGVSSPGGADLPGDSAAGSAPLPSESPKTVDRSDFGPDAINLDFDDLDGGTVYMYCNGDVVTDQYENVSFEVPGAPCSVCANSYLGGMFPNNSGPNVAFVQQNFCEPEALFAQATFGHPVRRVGTDFWTTTYATFTLTIYDEHDHVIGEATVEGADLGGSWTGFLGLDAGSDIIARVELRSGPLTGPDRPFNFSMDDFIYEVSTPVSVRPASWGRVKAGYR